MAIFSSTMNCIYWMISPNVIRVVVNMLFLLGYIITLQLFFYKPPIYLHWIERVGGLILLSYIMTWKLYSNEKTMVIRIIFILNLAPAFYLAASAAYNMERDSQFQQLCGGALVVGCSSAFHMMVLQNGRSAQIGTLLAAFSGTMGSLPLFGFTTGLQPVFLLPLVIATLIAILLLLPAEENAEGRPAEDDSNILPMCIERKNN